ncbi:nucleoside hydrolase-like domain-containing protein [Tropicimonas marinistellae]|uniref:nucleoside hydrolase-like domain-containing protein n=1 Tax=Tropicimonas marinistellae TaxID=1739787 RepID=UPI000829A4AB|nr:nucleoside hydrolase-like domain-containing protein [Tropicimonas marinistellae]
MSTKPKVIISTDIGGNDKDDAQSLIHALLYADEVDYLGFIGTTSDENGVDSITPMEKIVAAYAKDLPNLSQDGDYPSAAEMAALITQGATEPDWPGTLSDGAKLIIEEARSASPDDPVYLLAWGPIHDIARALYEAPDIVENVRVISINPYGQDSSNPQAYNWLKNAVSNNADYADLWWILSNETFRGMYVGKNGENNPSLNMDWLEEFVDGHGALGELYFETYAVDLYGKGSVDGLKMGDTPSLLYLLDEVNNDDPTASSWGGSFKQASWGTNVWVDKTDSASSMGSYDGAATVYEHRDEVWGEFAELLDLAKDGSDSAGDGGSEPDDSGSDAGDDSGDDGSTGGDDGSDGGDGTTGQEGSETDDDPMEEAALPAFSIVGSNANETFYGTGSADSIYGGRGDDLIISRGQSDVVAGGAGNDELRAGAGNDTLIYVIGHNFGSTDHYKGYSGVDVLKIYGTAEELADSDLVDDIAALKAFITSNYDATSHSGKDFTFDSIGLTVRAIEKVELVLIDNDDTTTETDAEASNEAPDARDDSATTDEETAVTIAVLQNDTDDDGDSLSLSSVSQGSNGTVVLNSNGTVTYTPDADFAGSDSFSYTVSDGTDTSTATVSVTVEAADSDGTTGADDDDTGTPTEDALPEYEEDGSAGDDTLKGGGSEDSINGQGGDDYIVSRGDDDKIAGGSGSDHLRAGAGADILAYLIGKNLDDEDRYEGMAGFDKLQIYGTDAQLSDAAFLDDIAELKDFISDNYDTSSHGGEVFDFDSIGLSVRGIEGVELITIDDTPA